MPPSDQEYVQSCLDGRPEAFRLLVERYQAPLIGQLRHALGDAREAEEVAQEAFVRAYFALARLRNPEAFFPWLVGIADRVAKERHRAAKRTRSLEREPVEPEQPAAARDSEVETTVGEAVARLPDVYREVVVLRFYGGRSCQEISRDLGVPLGTVTKRLSRAYALLRERLGPAFFGQDRSDDETRR